ncbi:MAG: hypothetical protein R3211_11655 [Balneolaceae bacterium]|nr:hypothetical protein [Balneolaceae bacterium]
MSTVAVILGSAYLKEMPEELSLSVERYNTPWGDQILHRVKGIDREAYILFRHGLPHRLLPNQINYRAQAHALKLAGCKALLVTSSVGVLDTEIPLFQPLLVNDILMPDNRLPDGSACTMYREPSENHGHLVLSEGLLSIELNRQLQSLGEEILDRTQPEVVFAYVGGPRGKSSAENRYWSKMGAKVNSMTLAPEVVLANELEIPCAGLVAGHKYSVPDHDNPQSKLDVTESLDRCRESMEELILKFLREGEPVPFANHIYRFD